MCKRELGIPLAIDGVLVTIFVSHSFSCFNDLNPLLSPWHQEWRHSIWFFISVQKTLLTDCTILWRRFERVSVPAHVRDTYKIKMADCELAVVSGRTRRLFPRVRFYFWLQRRHHTGILFLSCEFQRSRSRLRNRSFLPNVLPCGFVRDLGQNSREPKRQTSFSSLLLEYDLKSR